MGLEELLSCWESTRIPSAIECVGLVSVMVVVLNFPQNTDYLITIHARWIVQFETELQIAFHDIIYIYYIK